jgi:predicted metalloprotease with PDZ domain
MYYKISFPEPNDHLFHVDLTIDNWQKDVLDVKMPVWTPGSYLVREYARHLRDFQATADGKPLDWEKVAKNHWRIDTNGANKVIINYRVFANELTVRTNHLDNTHGYFNPAALCLFVPELIDRSLDIEICPPKSNWQVFTPLPQREDDQAANNVFTALDYDTLVDSPFEIGTHEIYRFEAGGKPHELVIWGENNLPVDRTIADFQKIIECEKSMFGELPYERYQFLLHLSGNGRGGLEHKDCCSLLYPRFGFHDRDKYNGFLQLVAHEFFHLWNVKRLRPKGLEVFDYERENYTPSLWFSEGTTSYYDLLIPLRAGIYDRQTYINELSQEISRYLTTPGRLVQPLTESSFDAWIKLYRPDSHSHNVQMSYYLKGAMVSLLLDLEIRLRTRNKFSFDTVMKQMWERFGVEEVGFTETQLREVINSVAGANLHEFYADYLDGLKPLPIADYLDIFGVELIGNTNDRLPYTGIKISQENNRGVTVTAIDDRSPSRAIGLSPSDEILAINGYKVTRQNWEERLQGFSAGEKVEITFFQGDRLVTELMTLAKPQPHSYKLQIASDLSPNQKNNLDSWLGVG